MPSAFYRRRAAESHLFVARARQDPGEDPHGVLHQAQFTKCYTASHSLKPCTDAGKGCPLTRRPTYPHSAFASALAACLALGLTALACSSPDPATDGASSTTEKISVTTLSDEARQAYRQGRQLAESLRAADARPYFQEAVDLDDGFALAYLALANSATSTTEFFTALQQAVDRVDNVSPGERLMIEAQNAAIKRDPEGQRGHLERLVALHPNDERAQTLRANFHFGRQEYAPAIRHFVRATEIAPDYPPPYNSLGYALRAQGKLAEAESTFKKYIEVLPDEPNPYDSYAELQMKMGRFEASISAYRQALEKDPQFVASWIGIGTNQIFLGQTVAARETFQGLYDQARSVAERRQAVTGILASYLFLGDHAGAMEQAIRLDSLAEEIDDRAARVGDLNLMGNILLAAGTLDEASGRFDEAVRAIELAAVPDEVKEATRRTHLYQLARVALAAGDLEEAATRIETYRTAAAAAGIPFELRRGHELTGRLALAREDYSEALTQLEKANQQDPRVLYWTALACRGVGDRKRAVDLSYRAATWNSLGLNYAFVHNAALSLVEELDTSI